MRRIGEQRRGGSLLDDDSAPHDRNAIADLRRDSEIVSDEEHGKPKPFAQIHQQAENLRLDGDVERADRLVGDQQFGLHRKCPRNADPLSLAAAKLMGKAIRGAGIELDEFEQFDRAGPAPSHAERHERAGLRRRYRPRGGVD